MNKVSFPVLMLAGLCGGMAEVAWVAAYSAATGFDGFEVARQIAATVLPSVANVSWAPLLGIAIHFVLSIALAIAFGWLVWQPFALAQYHLTGAVVGIAVLCLIWALNFMVVLPALNPGFVALMPYPVTLLSKILFAAAMVGMLQTTEAFPSRVRSPMQVGY